MRKKDKLKNMVKANLLHEQRYNQRNLDEVSADKIMGAAKKMWDERISASNSGELENPRAEKLLTDYANKLKGLDICGGEISSCRVDLSSTDGGGAFYLIFTMLLSRDTLINGFSGFYYNYSTDKLLVGPHKDSLTPIEEFPNTNLTKFDARQLYKVASHFNPNTRYSNYSRIIPINNG